MYSQVHLFAALQTWLMDSRKEKWESYWWFERCKFAYFMRVSMQAAVVLFDCQWVTAYIQYFARWHLHFVTSISHHLHLLWECFQAVACTNINFPSQRLRTYIPGINHVAWMEYFLSNFNRRRTPTSPAYIPWELLVAMCPYCNDKIKPYPRYVQRRVFSAIGTQPKDGSVLIRRTRNGIC